MGGASLEAVSAGDGTDVAQRLSRRKCRRKLKRQWAAAQPAASAAPAALQHVIEWQRRAGDSEVRSGAAAMAAQVTPEVEQYKG